LGGGLCVSEPFFLLILAAGAIKAEKAKETKDFFFIWTLAEKQLKQILPKRRLKEIDLLSTLDREAKRDLLVSFFFFFFLSRLARV
jgi:hypothetical protein